MKKKGKANEPAHRAKKRGAPAVPAKRQALRDFTPDEVITYARGLITGEWMLADVRDRDWQHSLLLMLSGLGDVPPNASSYLMVPTAPHMGGLWLNGKVPGVTLSAVMMTVESARRVAERYDEMWEALQ